MSNKNSTPTSEHSDIDRCPSCGDPCDIFADLDSKDRCRNCRPVKKSKKKTKKSPEESAFTRLAKKIPLDIRVQVCLELSLLSLPSDLGYRKPEMWKTKKDRAIYDKIREKAKSIAEDIMRTIDKWEKDGKPTRSKRLKTSKRRNNNSLG